MKKILFVVCFLSFGSLKADIGSQITTSLISHISTHSEWTTKGENRLALLTDIIEIGKLDNKAIGQIRFGFTGITNPDSSVTPGAGYVADAYVNLAPFVRKYVSLNPDWTFLGNVEMGPAFSYDFREHHSYLAFSVGLAFGLNPK